MFLKSFCMAKSSKEVYFYTFFSKEVIPKAIMLSHAYAAFEEWIYQQPLVFQHITPANCDLMNADLWDEDREHEVCFPFGSSELVCSGTSFWSFYVSSVLNGLCAFSEAY